MTDQPLPRNVLEAFGLEGQPERTHSSDVWRVGPAAIKRVSDLAEAQWIAELLSGSHLPMTPRLAAPIQAGDGRWVVAGWSASAWMDGNADGSRWAEVITAGNELHRWLAQFDRPEWLDCIDDPWRRADRLAWGEDTYPLDPGFMPLIEELERMRGPLNQPSQLVHGDLTGNVLFASDRPPAVIDLTLYWRPAGYADAVVAIDAFEWEGAGPEALRFVAKRPHGFQLLVRGALFRISRSAMSPEANSTSVLDVHRRTVGLIQSLWAHP